MQKSIVLNSFELHKLKEFFNPKMNQVQILFIEPSSCPEFLMAIGYQPNGNTKRDENGKLLEVMDGFWYFDIPEQFRYKTITVEKEIHW